MIEEYKKYLDNFILIDKLYLNLLTKIINYLIQFNKIPTLGNQKDCSGLSLRMPAALHLCLKAGFVVW